MRNDALEPLVGEWRMTMAFPGLEAPEARVTEWVGDRAFLLERWSVPIPEAPDGLAVMDLDGVYTRVG
jgi:hypothetical protein